MFTVRGHLDFTTHEPYEWGIYEDDERVAICDSKPMAKRICSLLNAEVRHD